MFRGILSFTLLAMRLWFSAISLLREDSLIDDKSFRSFQITGVKFKDEGRVSRS